MPYAVEVGPIKPTIDISNCSTIICYSDCPEILVDQVMDGDTFQSANVRIHPFGVDTSERGEKCFEEATERFKELAGDTVRLEFGPRREDPFGRILYYIYTADGESIDEMLVRVGLARAWKRDGQHRDVLVAAEKGAQRDGFGCLW